MEASITDLRFKTRDILRALAQNEPVTLTYHGKTAGVIMPPKKAKVIRPSLKDDPFVGMGKGDKEPVEAIMARLRAPRYADMKF